MAVGAVDEVAETSGRLVAWAVAFHFVRYKVASFDYNRHCTYFPSKADYAVYPWPDSHCHNSFLDQY